MTNEEFIVELEKIGIKLSEKQLNQLNLYYEKLVEWNKKINLTSITDKKDVYLKHFYDSLTIYKIIDLNKIESLCDVGTGAGFPGIVLKIVFPNLKITLIDSLNKRIVFLNEIIKLLDLDNIEALHFRMEDYSKINIEKFDCVVSRAVANLSMIYEISVQSIKVNGYFVAMKANCDDEINYSKPLLEKLESKIVEIKKFNLPCEDSIRTLIKIQKIKKTDNKYPRNIDKIKKSLKNK